MVRLSPHTELIRFVLAFRRAGINRFPLRFGKKALNGQSCQKSVRKAADQNC